MAATEKGPEKVKDERWLTQVKFLQASYWPHGHVDQTDSGEYVIHTGLTDVKGKNGVIGPIKV